MPEHPALPADAVDRVRNYLLYLQDQICNELSAADDHARFQQDIWKHPAGGGGRTRAISGGKCWEKAGVNFSDVSGETLPPAASINRPELQGCKFNALGLSMVIHPNNPFVPTMHANVRFFIAWRHDGAPVWWFGGGLDLTPYYGFIEDCQHWHATAAAACVQFGDKLYPRFKAACDRYFYLPHRQEARGIGGLFFDDFHEKNFEHSFNFMQSIGNHVMPAYMPIVSRRQNHKFTEQHKEFQCYRRGRYVEFNLVYDRGTLFGLQSNGRTESILMSLPPEVRWIYDWQPKAGSHEAELYTHYLPARDWI